MISGGYFPVPRIYVLTIGLEKILNTQSGRREGEKSRERLNWRKRKERERLGRGRNGGRGKGGYYNGKIIFAQIIATDLCPKSLLLLPLPPLLLPFPSNPSPNGSTSIRSPPPGDMRLTNPPMNISPPKTLYLSMKRYWRGTFFSFLFF